MLRTISIAVVLSLATAGPAFARRCPMEMAAIDKALQTAQLSSSERQQVMDLRQRGEAAHAAGNHAESERLLDQAKSLLNI